MNRAQLKAETRRNMRNARTSPYLVTLIFILPALIFGGIVSGIAAGGHRFFSLEGEYIRGSIISALGLGTTVTVIGLSLVFFLMYYLLSVGYIGYCLRVSRGEEVSLGNLFDYINQPLRFLGLMLLMSLVTAPFSMFGSFLGDTLGGIFVLANLALSIVGIYVSLGFSQSLWVAIDRPELGVAGCMRESWQMMRGRRWEYFVLSLSFFGWALLCIFFFPLFFVYPYAEITLAGYYNIISGHFDDGEPEPAYEE